MTHAARPEAINSRLVFHVYGATALPLGIVTYLWPLLPPLNQSTPVWIVRMRVTAADILTAREIEVLRHVALGLSNKEIAAALSVREETVKTHVTHVLAKLDVANRSQAIVQALKRGIVALDELE